MSTNVPPNLQRAQELALAQSDENDKVRFQKAVENMEKILIKLRTTERKYENMNQTFNGYKDSNYNMLLCFVRLYGTNKSSSKAEREVLTKNHVLGIILFYCDVCFFVILQNIPISRDVINTDIGKVTNFTENNKSLAEIFLKKMWQHYCLTKLSSSNSYMTHLNVVFGSLMFQKLLILFDTKGLTQFRLIYNDVRNHMQTVMQARNKDDNQLLLDECTMFMRQYFQTRTHISGATLIEAEAWRGMFLYLVENDHSLNLALYAEEQIMMFMTHNFFKLLYSDEQNIVSKMQESCQYANEYICFTLDRTIKRQRLEYAKCFNMEKIMTIISKFYEEYSYESLFPDVAARVQQGYQFLVEPVVEPDSDDDMFQMLEDAMETYDDSRDTRAEPEVTSIAEDVDQREAAAAEGGAEGGAEEGAEGGVEADSTWNGYIMEATGDVDKRKSCPPLSTGQYSIEDYCGDSNCLYQNLAYLASTKGITSQDDSIWTTSNLRHACVEWLNRGGPLVDQFVNMLIKNIDDHVENPVLSAIYFNTNLISDRDRFVKHYNEKYISKVDMWSIPLDAFMIAHVTGVHICMYTRRKDDATTLECLESYGPFTASTTLCLLNEGMNETQSGYVFQSILPMVSRDIPDPECKTWVGIIDEIKQNDDDPSILYRSVQSASTCPVLRYGQYKDQDRGGNGDCLYRNLAFLASENGIKNGAENWTAQTLRQACMNWMLEPAPDEDKVQEAYKEDLKKNINYLIQEFLEKPFQATIRETGFMINRKVGNKALKAMTFEQRFRVYVDIHRGGTVWANLVDVGVAAWVLRTGICIYRQINNSTFDLRVVSADGPLDASITLCLWNKGATVQKGSGLHFAAICPLIER